MEFGAEMLQGKLKEEKGPTLLLLFSEEVNGCDTQPSFEQLKNMASYLESEPSVSSITIGKQGGKNNIACDFLLVSGTVDQSWMDLMQKVGNYIPGLDRTIVPQEDWMYFTEFPDYGSQLA